MGYKKNNKVRNGKTYLNLFLLASFIILLSSFVESSRVVVNQEYGLHINTWTVDTGIKQNQPFTFVWDVSDANGALLKANTTNCMFITYPSGVLGNQIGGKGNITTDGNGWYFIVNQSRFTKIGQWNFQIDCYLVSNSTVSGNALDSFNVNPASFSDNKSFFFFIAILIYAIAFIGFFGKNEWVAIFGGIAMIPLGLYMINNGIMNFRDTITDVVSWITIGIGAFFALYSTMSLIQDNM